jgi:hypothetical protein
MSYIFNLRLTKHYLQLDQGAAAAARPLPVEARPPWPCLTKAQPLSVEASPLPLPVVPSKLSSLHLLVPILLLLV